MLEHEHRKETRRHRYRYLFTLKHHGGHGDGQWLTESTTPSLSEDEEFHVFDVADGEPDTKRMDDEVQCADEDGNLYGVYREGETLRYLGKYDEQIAKFWKAPEGRPWHGFPVWALNKEAPGGLRKRPSPKEVIDKMLQIGLITWQMRTRLRGGKHA